MIKRTAHGDNIANQICGEDAYGEKGILTMADLWNLLDQVHTQACETDDTAMQERLSRWMDELSGVDEIEML